MSDAIGYLNQVKATTTRMKIQNLWGVPKKGKEEMKEENDGEIGLALTDSDEESEEVNKPFMGISLPLAKVENLNPGLVEEFLK